MNNEKNIHSPEKDADNQPVKEALSTSDLRKKIQDKRSVKQAADNNEMNKMAADEDRQIDVDLHFEPAISPVEEMDLQALMAKYLPEEDQKFIVPMEEEAALEPDAQQAEEAVAAEDVPDEPLSEEEFQVDPLSEEELSEIRQLTGMEIPPAQEMPVPPAYAVPAEPQKKHRLFGGRKKKQQQMEMLAQQQYADQQYADQQYVDPQYGDQQYAEQPYNDQQFNEQQPYADQQLVEQIPAGQGEEAGIEAQPDGDQAAMDETDVKLMMAFGMEDELAQTIGFDKITQVEDELAHEQEMVSEEESRKNQQTRAEFSDYAQAKGIFARYKKQYHSLLLRMAAALVLIIFAFFFENIDVFGGKLPDSWNALYYPVVHSMIGLQLLVLGCALIAKNLIRGAEGLLKGKPVAESIMALVTAITVIYDVAHCWIKPESAPRLYSLPLLIAVFLILLFDMFNIRREIYGFNIVASKRGKFTLMKLDEDEAGMEEEAFEGVLPQNPSIFRITRTKFADDFFARLDAEKKDKKIYGIYCIVSAAIALVVGIAGLILSKSIYTALVSAYVALLFAAPMSLFITYSYPFYRASREAYHVGGAIIGEQSLADYSQAGAISFEDTDVFPDYGVKLKSMKYYGSYPVDAIIYYAASLFRITGGPIAASFEAATRDITLSDRVDILRVESNGIEAVVDDQHIHVGKAEYLADLGYVLDYDGDDDDLGEISVMYMAIENEVAAKINIQYVIDPDFDGILKQLYKIGLCVGIKTFDPNIDDQMISSRIQINKYPVKVIKYSSMEDMSVVKEHQSSGIVSKQSAKSLLQTLSLCDRVVNTVKNNTIIKIVTMAVALLLSVIFLALKVSTGIASLYVALYQLFWIVPVCLIARICIGKL